MSSHPVLDQLLSSNAQWAKDVEQAEPGFFEASAKGQTPKVLWIGCADSRVPESVVLAVRPGEVFVTRNIANQFMPEDDNVNSVVTYALTLGVEHVVIVGHTNCGGAVECYKLANKPPSSSPATPLMRWLQTLIGIASKYKDEPLDDALPKIVEDNVKKQVHNLSQSPMIQEAWDEGKQVYIHGWVYHLDKGTLRDLKVSQGPS